MKIRNSLSLVLCAAMLSLFLVGCSTKQPAPAPQPNNVSVGIARFTQPMSTADLLAGSLAENNQAIKPGVLTQLDNIFDSTLSASVQRSLVDSNASAACEEKVNDKNTGVGSAMRYWVAVGKCMNVNLILVPMVLRWEEREGGQAGVDRPASVMLDFFLIDVREGTLVSRSRYDETQAQLTDNLLEVRTFFRRGARWVTASDLAREGMDRAIKSMGL